MATNARTAVSPGVPMNPSICWHTKRPWSPPGLKWESANMGDRNFESVIDPQIIRIINARNHFSSLKR